MLRILTSSELPEGSRPVNVLKKNKTADGNVRVRRPAEKPKQQKALEMTQKLVEAGVVGPPNGKQRLRDRLDQYILLENIGTPHDVIVQVMDLDHNDVKALRKLADAYYSDTLIETGVLGHVSRAIHRIDLASKKALFAMSSAKESDVKSVMEAARSLVQFEAEKVNILVRTGAVKVKRKVTMHEVLEESGTGDPTLLTGHVAQGLLQMIVENETSFFEDAIAGRRLEEGSQGDPPELPDGPEGPFPG